MFQILCHDCCVVVSISSSVSLTSCCIQSIKLEWCLNNLKEAQILLDEATKKYPDFAKMWMMKGQIAEQTGDVARAREAYSSVSCYITVWLYCPLWDGISFDKTLFAA